MKQSIQRVYCVGIVCLALVITLLPFLDLARVVIVAGAGVVCNPCGY